MAGDTAYGGSGWTQPSKVLDLTLHVAVRSIFGGSEPPTQAAFRSPMNASAQRQRPSGHDRTSSWSASGPVTGCGRRVFLPQPRDVAGLEGELEQQRARVNVGRGAAEQPEQGPVIARHQPMAAATHLVPQRANPAGTAGRRVDQDIGLRAIPAPG